MANLFEHEDRRVIPNWRSFEQTIFLGELNSLGNKNSSSVTDKASIDEYINEWDANKTLIHASELISAAIVNNKKESPKVSEAASFILENSKSATPSQISVSKNIVKSREEYNYNEIFEKIKIENLNEFIEPNEISLKINILKSRIKKFPYNPILYVELSRYYSIIGQEKQSVKAMQIALHLAPENRFILRSATRLFLHFDSEGNDYLDFIHNFLRKSPVTQFDPWLTSAEISISTLRNRNSRLIKKGQDLVNSKNINSFNLTELASSLGTVELLNGSNKKSKDFFKIASKSPNDNSLAQLKWAATKDKQLEFNVNSFNIRNSFEALALENFGNGDYNTSLEFALKWFIDMPFSKRAVMFGSNLSSMLLKDQKKSIALLNAGLVSHPSDPQIINNLAYAHALNNNSAEALKELNKVKNTIHIEETTKICLNATRGLALFRAGLYDEGRTHYLEAIESTNDIQDRDLNWIAILNYAREEILIDSEHVEYLMQTISKIPKNVSSIEINVLRKDVEDLHASRKSK